MVNAATKTRGTMHPVVSAPCLSASDTDLLLRIHGSTLLELLVRWAAKAFKPLRACTTESVGS